MIAGFRDAPAMAGLESRDSGSCLDLVCVPSAKRTQQTAAFAVLRFGSILLGGRCLGMPWIGAGPDISRRRRRFFEVIARESAGIPEGGDCDTSDDARSERTNPGIKATPHRSCGHAVGLRRRLLVVVKCGVADWSGALSSGT